MTAIAENVIRSVERPANTTVQSRVAATIDRLDVQILREFLQGPVTLPLNPDFRRSFRSVARVVGVDEDTVRNRAKRLERSGFIDEWAIMLNPNLLGFRQTSIFVTVPSSTSKRELVSRLRLVPDVFLILDMYGGNIGLMIAYDSPVSLKTRVDLIKSLTNVPNIRLHDALWPNPQIKMSLTDWRILKSLRRDPRRSYTSVAQEVRTSTRTVRRRIQRMVQAKAMFAIVSLNPKVLQGTVLASLAVYHSAGDRLTVQREVYHELDDYLWHAFFTIPTDDQGTMYTWFSLALPSVAKAREVLEWAQAQPCLREPRVELWEDHIVLLRTLDHWFDRKLHSLGLS